MIKKLLLFLLSCSVYASDYIVADDETEVFLTEIVNNIKSALGYKRNIRVYIASDQTLNAAAIQSGDIIVNAGAIMQSENYKELITILAHEVGHIAGHHIQVYISQVNDFMKAGLVPTLIGLAITVVSGDGGALLAGIISGSSISQGMALAKMRQSENIADTKAAEALKKLGWNIFDGCIALHKKLGSHTFIYNEYLSTHPLSSKRVAKYKQYYSELQNKPMTNAVRDLLKKYNQKFKIIKSKLTALVIQHEFLKDLYNRQKDDNEKYARAVALYRLGRYSEAVARIDELQKNDIEQTAYYYEIKCMSLINLKRCKEAAECARHALQNIRNMKHHRDLVVIYAEAVSAGNLRNYVKDAIKRLNQILMPKEDDISALHELGKLYTIDNQLHRGSYYVAQKAFLMNDLKLAKTHAKKARASSDASLRRKASDLLGAIADAEQESGKTRHAVK